MMPPRLPQTVASMAQWDTLVKNNVIGEFERPELAPFTKLNLKSDQEIKALFEDAGATSRPVPARTNPGRRRRPWRATLSSR